MTNKKTISPITNRKIRIAIVGCGRISRNHIRSVLINKDSSELVCICDPNLDNLQSALTLIEEIKVKDPSIICTPVKFCDYNDLLDQIRSQKVKVDLIILATPSGLHSSQVIAGSKLGIHMCSEKPMATNLIDGKRMLDACKTANVHLFVVKQNRLNPTLQLLKKQIKNNKFGKIALVTINVFWQRPQSYYDQDDWRGTWQFDGGCLMNQASHYIDLLDWLIGPVKSINASIATLGRNIEVEDTATLNIKWANGALGTMAVTMLTYPKNLEGSITILGDKGTARIGGKAVNEIEIWEFKDCELNENQIKNASYETSSVYGFGHPIYYKNMINTIRGLENPICDGEDGLKSLELLEGSYTSAKTDQTVEFPLSIK